MTVIPRQAVTDRQMLGMSVGDEFLIGGNIRGTYTRLQDFQGAFPHFQFRVTEHAAYVYRVRRVR